MVRVSCWHLACATAFMLLPRSCTFAARARTSRSHTGSTQEKAEDSKALLREKLSVLLKAEKLHPVVTLQQGASVEQALKVCTVFRHFLVSDGLDALQQCGGCHRRPPLRTFASN